MKTKITLEQCDADSDVYRVMSLVNRVKPRAGSTLTAAEVEELLANDEELTVNVKKAR
jgi:hypothetical protein